MFNIIIFFKFKKIGEIETKLSESESKRILIM